MPSASKVYYDLDILQPEPVIVRLLGEEINIAFIPASTASKVEGVQRRLRDLSQPLLDEDGNAKELKPEDIDLDYLQTAQGLQAEIVDIVAASQVGEGFGQRVLDECNAEQFAALIELIVKHLYGPRTAHKAEEGPTKAETTPAKRRASKTTAGTGPSK